MFEIATTSRADANSTGTIVVAQGATSGKTAGVVLPTFTSFSSTSSPITGATSQTILQNALVFSSTAVGATNGRGKSTNDEVADVTFNAANSGSLLLNNATFTFQGSAASSTGDAFINSVKLLDPSGNAVTRVSTGTVASGCEASGGSCTVTFSFAGRQVNGAQTYKLTVDDSKETIASGNSSVSLYATVNVNTDVSYVDAVTGGTTTTLPIILQPGNVIFPLNLNSVTYSQGT